MAVLEGTGLHPPPADYLSSSRAGVRVQMAPGGEE